MSSICKIGKDDALKIFPLYKNDSNVFFVEIQGKDIETLDDYMLKIEKSFHFPSPCEGNANRFLDWMRDLTWLDEAFFCKMYILAIHDFSSIFFGDLYIRNEIERYFIEIIFPWWDGDVEKFSVGGKRKEFNVYFVD